MARPAPSVDRIVSVLNFLAAQPGESFTLSELSRRLDLNKATCHAMLATLTDAGYLLRHPTRMTYSLGPTLIALGSAAAQGQFQAVDFARDEMYELSDELGLQCVASTAVGEEIVILARTGARTALGESVELGQRLPLVPPLGTVFMAWAEPDEIDRWLQRQRSWATEAQLDHYAAALAGVRDRGYAVALDVEARARLGQALAELVGEARGRETRQAMERLIDELGPEEYILTDLVAQRAYHVNTIGAPVFGAHGEVELGLFLVGFRDQLSGEDVSRHGERLRDSAGRVTKAIHGAEPTL